MKVIALDVGTTHIKATIVDPNGALRKSISTKTGSLSHPYPTHMEMNPEEVFRNLVQVFSQTTRALADRDVLISLSCMAPLLILADKDCKPIRPAILYNDLRTTKEVDEVSGAIGIEELLRINGNPANLQQWAPKILWIRKHESAIASKMEKLLDLSSYIIWRLTGYDVVDYTTAEEGGLLDYSRRKWSDRMLSFLGLDDSSLPELKHTLQQNEISSETTKSRLGLKGRRVVVTSSCVDAVSTPIGSGVIDEGKLSLELGTTGIVYTPTRTPKPDRRLYLDLSPIEDLYLVGGGTAASGIFYDWIIQLLNKGKVDYKRCEQWARSSRPGSRGIIILPYILGERTPIFDMSARAVIFGLQQDHSRSDLVRAAMEGVAYSFLHHLRVLQEVGYEVTAGTITGGGAKSPLFREIVTDVLGIPLFYHPIVSTTVGTAFIGYMSAGMKNDWEGVKEWFMERKKLSPKTSNRQLYDGHFSIYLDLYKKHREDFTFLSKDQQN